MLPRRDSLLLPFPTASTPFLFEATDPLTLEFSQIICLTTPFDFSTYIRVTKLPCFLCREGHCCLCLECQKRHLTLVSPGSGLSGFLSPPPTFALPPFQVLSILHFRGPSSGPHSPSHCPSLLPLLNCLHNPLRKVRA